MSLNKSSLVGLSSQGKTRLQVTAATITDAAAQTVTISQLSSFLMSQTPTADRTVTLPSAAVLMEATALYNNLNVADGIPFLLRNLAAPGSGFDITLAVGAGGTADTSATLTIAAGTQVEYLIRMDDAALGSEAYTLYTTSSSGSSSGGPGAAYISGSVQDGIGLTTAINHSGYAKLVTGTPASNGPALGITQTAPSSHATYTVTHKGVYYVSFGVTASYGAAEQILFGILLNAQSTIVGDPICSLQSNTGGDIQATAGSQVMQLSSGDSIAVAAASSSTDANLTLYNYNISIMRVL